MQELKFKQPLKNTYKLFNLGLVVHKEDGTFEMLARSNLKISKALVPFKFGNDDSWRASDNMLEINGNLK